MKNRKGVFVGGWFIDEDRMMNGIQEEVVDDFEEEVVVKAKPKTKVSKVKKAVVAKPKRVSKEVLSEVSKEVSEESKEDVVEVKVDAVKDEAKEDSKESEVSSKEVSVEVLSEVSKEVSEESIKVGDEAWEKSGWKKYREHVNEVMKRKRLEFEIEIKLSKLAPIMDECDRIYLEHIKVKMRNERVIRNIENSLSTMDAKSRRIFSRVNSKLKKECWDKIFAIGRQLHLHNPLWEFNSKCESLGLNPDAVRDELSLRRGWSIVPYHLL